MYVTNDSSDWPREVKAFDGEALLLILTVVVTANNSVFVKLEP